MREVRDKAMKGSLAPYKERLLRERKKWKRWQKAVSIMGTLVVFCTAYALILPAVTMGKETYCGQEEHQHSEDCYLLMRRGAATPGNAVPVLPGDIPVSTPSNAEEADPATPSNAGEATGNLPGPGEGNNISGETSKQESLATPGNAQGNKGVASLLLQAEQNLSKQLVSEVKESKYRLHSASNSSQWKKKEEEKTENKYWDLDEDEWYEEDMDLINDLEPEEEEEELEDYVPYEPGMDYDEELYELVMICGKEEHTHSLVCYSDPEADLESEEDWLRTLPQLTGDLPQDIVAVAESQVEYRESEKNYKVEGVDTVKGYTRYGQWYGNPYGDWNGMFASFCVNYAGGEDAPMDADSEGLAEKLKGTVPGLYKERGEYEPSLGDLIFLSDKEEEKLRVGIIKDVTRNEEGSVERVVVIEGDSHDKVGYQTYSLTSGEIQGYGLMSRYGENLITLTAETENAMITAVYEEGALPENVQLQAVEMAKDDERAVEMKEKLTEQGMSQGKVLTTMLPFDITFLDEEGNLVEPSGLIQISAEFKTPVKNEAEATGEDNEEFASQETDSRMTEKSGEETEDENIREDEEANEPDIKISAESAKQVSLSANVVTRVGTGIVNESKGQDQAEPEGESQVETTVQTETEPAWELFQMPEDGEPEKISDSESIKIEADEENALYGVTFQSRSSLQWAAAAFAARTGTATEVKTFRELKNALEEEGIKLVVLGADIIVKPAADGDWDIFQAIQMTSEKQHHTLNLNGHTITVEDDNLTLVDIKNGASLTVKDEQEISLEDRESKTTEISEMCSLWHEDGEEVDKESVGKCLENNYNDENRTLEFYVTESNVVDSATGETTESLVKYQIQNPGIIRTTDTRKPQNTFYIEGGTLNWEGGAIVGCTNRAVMLAGENSILNLKGGYICGNTAVLGAGGAIQASGSSRIELSGTYISGNYVTGGNHGGAISLQDAAVLNMSGGYLTNNRADTNGGAVYADGGSLANPGKTSINLTGGYITNNLANFSGGGIFSGGKASDTNPNASAAEKESGSECCLTMKTNDNGLSGCIIARNLAIGGEGGGITFRTGTGSIESGYLTNNRTDTREHWGGGGIFISDGAEVYVENTLVTNNTAGGFGGGVTGCPTSRIYIALKDGMAIYDNFAGEAGEPDSDERKQLGEHLSSGGSGKQQDHLYAYENELFLSNGYKDFFCALACTVDPFMLGGGPARWTGSRDSLVVDQKNGGGNLPRLDSASIMGLIANPETGDKGAAQSAARVYINGNSSWTHAGGILCNGYMIVGEVKKIIVPDRMALEGTKALLDDKGKEQPLEEGQFEFEVFNGSFSSMGIFTNDEKGVINFNNRLPATEAGDFDYFVVESSESKGEIVSDSTVYRIRMHVQEKIDTEWVSPNGKRLEKYLYTIDQVTVWKRTDGKAHMRDEDGWGEPISEAKDWWKPNNKEQGYDILQLNGDNAAFTNWKQKSRKITIQKKWEKTTSHPGEIQVDLLADGNVVKDKTLTLNDENGWKGEWTNLPVKNDAGTDIVYSVKEHSVEGFHSQISVKVDSGETQNPESGKRHWVPATSLKAGEKYVIKNKVNNHFLGIIDNGDFGIVLIADPEKPDQEEDCYPENSFKSEYIFTAAHPIVWGNVTQKDRLVLGVDINGSKKRWLQIPTDKMLRGVIDTDGLYGVWGSSFEVTGESLLKGKQGPCYQPESESKIVKYYDAELKVYTLEEEPSSQYEITTEYTITNIPDEEVRFWLTIEKVSETNEKIMIPNAEFQLIDKATNKILSFEKDTQGIYSYVSEDSKPDEGESGETKKTNSLITNKEGIFVLKNLPKGTYILREIMAPAGYAPVEDQMVELDKDKGTQIKLVVKEPEFSLPKTGGPGSYWYALGGMLLIAGSLVYGYSSRRKSERRVRK